MGFKNWPNRIENVQNTGLGIGPYDYVEYSYSNNFITQANYYIGANGSANSSMLIATVDYGYDANNNLISINRSFGARVT